jgi:UTP--glucose-1-phosphate uridylyltransferase
LGPREDGNKYDLIKEIKKISEMANFVYIRQKGPYGNGTPVLSAEPAIEDEFFAVMWGDEFIYSTPPRLSQMMKVHEKTGGAVISAVRIEKKEDLKRYGIAEIEHVEGNVHKIKKIVEKPEPVNAPSNLATHGAYILPPEIFQILKDQKPGTGGEIYLPEAIDALIKTGFPVYACEIDNAHYYDTGNKLEYMKAVIEFGLRHPDLNGTFRNYLKSLDL